MRAHLLTPDADFDPQAKEPPFTDDLVQDLQLDYLLDAMASGDAYLRALSRAVLVRPQVGPEGLLYRQRALADAMSNAQEVRDLYALAVRALDVERGIFMMPVKGRPESVLFRAVRVLTALADRLEELRSLCAQVGPGFTSAAFQQFFTSVARELDDAYMHQLRERLRELAFPDGMVMSAGLGHGGAVTRQVLRRRNPANRHFWSHTPLKRPFFTFTLADRDEAGHNALAALRDRSLVEVANAAAQSVDHVMGFFRGLRAELGVLLAGMNASAALRQRRVPCAFPAVSPSLSARGLYDPCLALRMDDAPVTNDVDVAEGAPLVITGANWGGKSTFLRALGTVQLMMQAGLEVPAAAFSAPIVGQVFTHWAREEDERRLHGKLDEELDRMQRIVAAVRPGDLLLANESFASTTEAEGAQILLEVVRALVAGGVHVRCVTHLYDFAKHLHDDPDAKATFLRAPRDASGTRTYHLEHGAPLSTSFGLDLYDAAFGTAYADAS